MNEIVVQANAKINLGLLLLKERDDGFTDIATVFQEISLADTLRVRRTEAQVRIACDHPSIPVGRENLIWKAFDCFQARTGIDWGIDVHLEKRIPTGGGLGGGSSNAAATLAVLNRLTATPLEKNELNALALDVGSDVPFFLAGGTAMGEGRGEILTPLNRVSRYFIVLLLPGIHVSTAWAYGASKIALTKNKKISTFRALFRDLHLEDLKASLVNEMEDAVFQRYPRLGLLKAGLYESGALYASMSGSGSTLYGLYRDEAVASEAVQMFSRHNHVQAVLCQPVS